MGVAQRVGRVFFPLDEELALLPGTLAPKQQRHLVQLASWMPFNEARHVLQDLLGVQVSKETPRRLTEEVGARIEEVQTAEAHQPWKEPPAETGKTLRMAFSADGAMVPLTHGEWAETRTLVIGVVPPVDPKKGAEKVHVGDLSYFSRLTDAADFTALAETEMRRRHIVVAKEVCAVMDGADWLQSFIEMHRSDAVRMLDFPHAAEHLNQLLEALTASGHSFPPQMLERCLHVLKHRGPRALLRMTDRLTEQEKEREDVHEHLGYFNKRLSLMQYPLFRRAGWPIGSGMVESANKVVVEARLKGTGMRWERTNVNPMLTLRNGVCNHRWLETWQVACQQRQQLIAHQRRDRVAPHPETLQTAPQAASGAPSSSLPTPLLPPDPPAMIPGTSKPSKDHPWKRSPACRSKLIAKT